MYPGKYILSHETAKITVDNITANEFVHHTPARLTENSVVVLNSYSGTTAETVAALELAKAKGARTVAFTMWPERAIGQADEVVFYEDEPSNPPPNFLTIFPAVFQVVFTILDVLEGTDYLPLITAAMEQLDDIYAAERAKRADELRAFAEKYYNEPIFYTTGAGMDYEMCYIMSVCILLEAQWIQSAAYHAGEFFHGPFEKVDASTPYFVTLGLDETRPLEERALEFLLRTSDKVFAIDAKDFDLSKIDPSVRKWVAPVILNRVMQMYGEALATRRAHPLTIRRYMGKVKY
jgi:fructoselysine 6-phosphate deglycase